MATPQDNYQNVLSKLLVEVQKATQSSSALPVIVAIDGNCGAGKTFYSSKLATFFGASVIHCDDFFLPKELRTPERLDEVGGNIHYERLRALLNRLKNEKLPITCRQGDKLPYTYRAYNCSTDSYEEKNLLRTKVVIVEGSYALHPFLREFYDLKILLTVDKETQLARLLAREGEQGLVNFVNSWIPLENKYFNSLDTTDCIVLGN